MIKGLGFGWEYENKRGKVGGKKGGGVFLKNIT